MCLEQLSQKRFESLKIKLFGPYVTLAALRVVKISKLETIGIKRYWPSTMALSSEKSEIFENFENYFFEFSQKPLTIPLHVEILKNAKIENFVLTRCSSISKVSSMLVTNLKY